MSSLGSDFWLALDFSVPNATVALHSLESNGRLIFLGENEIDGQYRQSELILNSIESLLRSQNLELSKISRFITVSGPGSFTGLRIAMATIKAFAIALNKKVETVSGSEVRALGWLRTRSVPPTGITVVTRASRDRFVIAQFECEPTGTVRLGKETLETSLTLPSRSEGREIIYDDATHLEELPSEWREQAYRFPLKARLLAETLSSAKTRQCYSSIPDIIQLAPNYFGRVFKTLVDQGITCAGVRTTPKCPRET